MTPAADIRAPPRSLESLREIKVRIPARLHVHLHRLRILEGTGIAETITNALTAYFEQEKVREQAASGPPGEAGA